MDLRNGGGTLLLSGSTTEAESSELCAGPGHAGVLTADKSSSNTGTYFPSHTDQLLIITQPIIQCLKENISMVEEEFHTQTF